MDADYNNTSYDCNQQQQQQHREEEEEEEIPTEEGLLQDEEGEIEGEEDYSEGQDLLDPSETEGDYSENNEVNNNLLDESQSEYYDDDDGNEYYDDGEELVGADGNFFIYHDEDSPYHELYLQKHGMEFMMPILFEDGMDYVECQLYYASLLSQSSGGAYKKQRTLQPRRSTMRELRSWTDHIDKGTLLPVIRKQTRHQGGVVKRAATTETTKINAATEAGIVNGILPNNATGESNHDNDNEKHMQQQQQQQQQQQEEIQQADGPRTTTTSDDTTSSTATTANTSTNSNTNNTNDADHHYRNFQLPPKKSAPPIRRCSFSGMPQVEENFPPLTRSMSLKGFDEEEPRVCFEEYVQVVTIFPAEDLPDDVRSQIWMSREEMSKCMRRAMMEDMKQQQQQEQQQQHNNNNHPQQQSSQSQQQDRHGSNNHDDDPLLLLEDEDTSNSESYSYSLEECNVGSTTEYLEAH